MNPPHLHRPVLRAASRGVLGAIVLVLATAGVLTPLHLLGAWAYPYLHDAQGVTAGRLYFVEGFAVLVGALCCAAVCAVSAALAWFVFSTLRDLGDATLAALSSLTTRLKSRLQTHLRRHP